MPNFTKLILLLIGTLSFLTYYFDNFLRPFFLLVYEMKKENKKTMSKKDMDTIIVDIMYYKSILHFRWQIAN